MRLQSSLQAKILRTKKKLSSPLGLLPGIIAVAGLMACFAGLMTVVMAPGSYNLVETEFPVVPATLEDPALHRYSERPERFIKMSTPTVVMTLDALYLGDMSSFSELYADSRTKIQINHKDHSPQIGNLLDVMKKWVVAKAQNNNWRNEGILVFAPTGNIPAAIVIQVMHALQNEGSFKQVILAGGLI